MRFFKIVDEDLTDFISGEVRYEIGRPAVVSGDGPFPGTGWLHASVTPWGCVQNTHWWPCRLFEARGVPRAVHTTGEVGFTQLALWRELESWSVLGPHGREVLAMIERARGLERFEALTLARALSAHDALQEATFQEELGGPDLKLRTRMPEADQYLASSVWLARQLVTTAVRDAQDATDPWGGRPWLQAAVQARIAVADVVLGHPLTGVHAVVFGR